MNNIEVVRIDEYPGMFRETEKGYVLKQERGCILTCENIDKNGVWRDLTIEEISNLLDLGIIVPSFNKYSCIMRKIYGVDDYTKKYPKLTPKEIIDILQKEREFEMSKYVGKDIATYLNNFYF